ncbi:MAG TPA: ATP-binding protein [Jatrophihabitantaceae bacterium]|nr:ATP-binding protein [Jatrophihabitantaceae bacterium]
MTEDERAAIASRLHDELSGRLAAVAARLDALMVRVADADVQRVIGQLAAELNDLTGGVRAIIVELQRGDDDPASVTGRIRGVVLAAGQSLGCTPRVTLDGDLDGLDDALADDLVAVADEALANVVRHSYAGMFELTATATGGRVTLEVRDDGVGPNEEPTSGTGLTSMRARAEDRGGEFLIEPNDPMGTLLRWSVPA